MNGWWLLIPLLTALTAYLTVQILLTTFFKRLLPQRRQQWTAQLAKKVATEFISFDGIAQKITSPENVQKIMPAVEVHVDEFLRNGLPKAFPIIGSFIGDRTVAQLKEIFLKELETIFPVVIKGYIDNLQKDLDPELLIINKLETISTQQMEKAFVQAAGTGLNRLKAAATAGGLLVGLLQLAIVIATK